MRITHVYKTYFPESQGGLEETIRQICAGTRALGAENRVLTLAPHGRDYRVEREEATVIRYRRDLDIASCGMSASALMAFRWEAREADIVHYHFPWPFADVMHFSGAVSAPTVLTYHSDVVRQQKLAALYRPLMLRFLKAMTRVVATSRNYFTTSPVLQSVSDRVEVIPIGLDEASYPVPDEAVLRRVQAEVGSGFFLFVGVLRYYKGLHFLLDAVANTNMRVVIAGIGPMEQELRARARELGLTNVIFLGYVSDSWKAALFRLCRAVVFPSHMRAEAFGLTLVEGAMFGRPLISSEMGTGTTYVNVHGESGLVVKPGDPNDLRAAMQRLSNDDELAGKLGAGARQRYERLFTGKSMANSYYNLYQHVLGG
ncbi:rhamnosyl/mannosyltransferase [Desulfosalsimonas propionicica]|uniref:Rhamnosyl/mannosyltransferase n=1 Tax=Desulfosalsimonas propionicica TaxID=332175 RepID=A0A7W0C6E8_9BACT|nr:glycosyltransferase [Desulfosalsimonas propionicica]MBA2880016.1 rhamnosyl/mannosyltransferase [Desulfosalsimonas propionicica]